MDNHEAVAHLDKYRKKWRQKIRGIFDQVFNTNSSAVDQDAVSMVADAEAAIAEVNSGLVTQGYYTSVVVIMDENRENLETSARRIEKAIHRLGYTARVETINTMDAFFGSLPGHGVENVRRPLLHTMNLADSAPNQHHLDWTEPSPLPVLSAAITASDALRHPRGNTVSVEPPCPRCWPHLSCLAPRAQGKSTHLAMIAAQLRRYQGMSVYVFDKGMAMYPLTKAMGGKHFTVAADGDQLAFCPLQYLETKGDRAWAMDWLDTVLALNNVITTHLHNAMRLVTPS